MNSHQRIFHLNSNPYLLNPTPFLSPSQTPSRNSTRAHIISPTRANNLQYSARSLNPSTQRKSKLQTMPGVSTIKYVPYEKKIIDYQQRHYVERVPIKKKIVQYEEKTIVDEVPRQVIVSDYFAVEKVREFKKEIVSEKKLEMMAKEKKVKKIEYMPVQKQIIHYPQNNENSSTQSKHALQKQGIIVHPNAEYKKLDPQLIYKYSKGHGNKPVGYVQDGCKRNLSTAPSTNMEDSAATSIKNILSPRNIKNIILINSQSVMAYQNQ